MPLRKEVVRAFRYFNTTPNVSERGIMHIAKHLREYEEEPGETQRYLKSAYKYLRDRQRYSKQTRIIKNIGRLSRAYKNVT